MEFLGFMFCSVCSALFTRWWLNRKIIHGEMDVEWNEEKQVWNASLHIPNNTNYHNYDKLVLNITKK